MFKPRISSFALLLLALCCAPIPGRAGEAKPLAPARSADVIDAVRAPGARAVLVNVWATWCAPCIEEMPYLAKLKREYGPQGLRLVLVSADFKEQAEAAAEFLAEQNIEAVALIKAEKDEAFIEGLHPEWGGALPASLLYDDKGKLHHFWEGAATYEDFESKVRELLD